MKTTQEQRASISSLLLNLNEALNQARTHVSGDGQYLESGSFRSCMRRIQEEAGYGEHLADQIERRQQGVEHEEA